MTGWLVATSHWGKQDYARENLENLSFNCYFPKFREKIIVNGRKTWSQRYLFDRYFFVKFVERWKEIFETRGVSGILMSQGEPSRVNDEIIREIRSREDSSGFIVVNLRSSSSWFRNGDVVRVNRGSLIGFHGVFDRGHGGERVKVLFDFFGRKSTIIMKSDEISKADIGDMSRSQRKRLQTKQRRLSNLTALNA